MRTLLWVIVGALVTTAALAQSSSSSAGATAGAAASTQSDVRTDRAVSTGAQTGATANAQAAAGPNPSASLSSDATMDAELTKAVDARKAKPGDQVTARLRKDVRQDGRVVLHRGTKLTGHVTEAQAKASGQVNSRLGIIFDRAELKDGQGMDLHVAIQALAPATYGVYDQSGMSDVGTSPSAGGSRSGATTGGGGGLGGLGSTAAGATREAGSAVGGAVQGAGSTVSDTGAAAGRTAAGASGALNASSRGAIGIPGLQISTELSNSTNGTVLVSNDKDIRLNSGTQLLLRVVNTQGTPE